MEFRFSRRRMMQGVGSAALAQSLETAVAAPTPRKWPIMEGPDTPKLCLSMGDAGSPLPAGVVFPAAGAGARGGAAPGAEGAGGAAPGAAGAGAAAGRGGRGAGGGGGSGGFLAPRPAPAPAPAPAPSADAAGRGGRGAFGGNPFANAQRILQLGVTHLLGVGIGGSPWTEEAVRRVVDGAKAVGLVAYNSMLGIPASIIYGRDTRAKDMESVIASIQAAGKGGLPVIEYNFYAHRATEGYYEAVGRARAGNTAFDYDLDLLVDETGRVLGPLYRDDNGQLTPETLAAFPNAKHMKFRDLPPLANEGAHNLEEMFANVTYFLKAAVPAAEKAGVRLALHPNDPPAPISRGSQQIMGSLAGWKRLCDIVKSPANGITFDSGVTREMGEDPVVVADYFASRKQINHVHYRNVQVVKPYEKYQELFIDMGMGDMFGVMKALVKNKYTGTIYPEHPRALDTDRDRVGPNGRLGGYPGGGGPTGITYSVAYTRAMLQAALESV